MIWDHAAAELVRAARGHRSQVALSRRLGYRGNPVCRWETGRRAPTAAEALRLLHLTGHDVTGALAAVRGPALGAPPLDDMAVASWLRSIDTHRTHAELAAALGLSRPTVSRWMSGASRPRLPSFLHLVAELTGHVTELVERLVGMRSVPSLLPLHDALQEARVAFLAEPASVVVRWMVATEAYDRLPQHLPGWLGEQLDIDAATEERCLTLLVDAGVLYWDGERYRSTGVPALRIGGTLEQRRVYRQGRLHHIARTIGAGKENDLVRDNVFQCSRAELAELMLEVQRAFEGLRERTVHTDGRECAAVLGFYLVGYGGPPGDGARMG
jgi:transcriptional regulator with XRE-family HTH domain